MKKQKIKLEVGQIWQVPKTPEVRVIRRLTTFDVLYCNIGGYESWTAKTSFGSWKSRKKAVLIGHYDFKKQKAVKA